MSNQGRPSSKPRTLAIALTLSLLLPAAAVFTAEEASGALSSCANLAENPIWIPNVRFYNRTGNQRTLFEDGAVFVDPGATIEIRIQVQNRVDQGECQGVQTDSINQVKGKMFYPIFEDETWVGLDGSCDMQNRVNCSNIRKVITIPDGPDVPLGEHRIRIVAAQSDGGSLQQETLTGAERVIVVGQRPDLVITSAGGPTSATTTYNEDDATSPFTLTIENRGDYPAWNPNGGRDWGTRSPFDAPYVAPAEDGQGTLNWGEDDATDYEPETTASETNDLSDSHSGGAAELPPCHDDPSEEQPSAGDSWGSWGDVPTCSYRYGVPLPVNLRYLVHQLNPEDTDLPRFGPILDEPKVILDDLVTDPDDTDYDDVDKDDTRLLPQYYHFVAPGSNDNVEHLDPPPEPLVRNVQAVDRNGKAGETHVNWTVDKDLDNRSLVPERNLTDPTTEDRNRVDLGELNNNATTRYTIEGPDLVFDTGGQGGPTSEDGNRGGAPLVLNKVNPSCGGETDAPPSQGGPCQPGTAIKVQFGYRNIGDWPIDSGDGTRSWRAAIYLNGELAECVSNCPTVDGQTREFAVWDFSDLPRACPDFSNGCDSDTGTRYIEGGGSEENVLDNAPEIKSLDGGGLHTIEVRLDDGALYPDDQLDDRYFRYAEYNETNTCHGAGDELPLYNRYCITLAFKDSEPPVISALETDPKPEGSEQVPKAREGEVVTFNATVKDPSTDEVRAIIETADGQQVANLTMTQLGDSDDYQATQRFLGQQANNTSAPDPAGVTYLPEDLSDLSGGLDLVYRVWANDTFGHTAQSADSDAVELNLTELPKDIDIVEFEFNGATNANPDNAPTYEGTASEPENWFNVTATISGDGRPGTTPEDPETQRADRTGKFVEVYDNRGDLRYTLPMEAMKVCTDQGVQGQASQTAYGSDCSTSEGDDPLGQITNVRWQFYVDTSKTEHVWSDAELDWAGNWSINITVEDVNNRTGEVQDDARFNDQSNGDNGRPLLDDVTLSPLEVGPAETLDGAAFVRDVLRVERVFLNATHQASGDTFELPLDYQGADTCDREGDACQNAEETDSGAWAARFSSGAGEDFARAGTYDVELVAVDFALNENTTDLGQVVVSDTDDPVIRQFFTLPEGGVQEVGGTVTWRARIDDATAIQPPVLDITFPSQDPKRVEMTFNETSGYWEHEETVPASEIGTWGYELTVSDYAGHAVSQTGEIEIKKTRPPQVKAGSWEPAVLGADGSTLYGPAQPTIKVDLVDFSDGVDLETVEMTVNGDSVDFQATAIPNGYELSHAVGSAFSDGDSVTVKVTAADNSGLANEAPLAHSFVVDATGPSATFEAEPAEEDDAREIIGDNTEISVDVTDSGAGPGPLTVTVQHLAGTTATAEETLTFDSGNGTFKLNELERAFQGHGDYRVLLTPTDAVGNEGSQITKRLLFDKSPPKVQVFAKPGQPREAIFADISDASTVTSAWVLYTPEGGEEERLDLQLVNGTWEGRIPAYPRNTTINFTVKAEDLFGNIGSSPEDSFEAGDAVPTITLTKPTGGETISGTTELTWTASDLETEASALKVSLYYKRPGQDFKPIPEAQDINNLGRYNLDTTILPNGELTLQAIVFDGNNFGDSKVTVTVRNLASIFNDPQLEGAEREDGKNLVEPGQEVVFSVQIDGTVQAAVANVTDQQGNLIESVNLEADGQGNWRGTFRAPTTAGDYNIDLIAQTAEGPVETENAYTFTVQGAGGEDSKSFVSEWTILSILFAGAVAVGALGLTQRWN